MRKKYILFIVGLLFISSFITVNAEFETFDNWTMFRHDLCNTGYSMSDAPDTNNLLWSNSDIEGSIDSSPVLIDDKLVITYRSGIIYCLNATNSEIIWENETGKIISFSSPAVLDNKVYVGSTSGLFCYNLNNGELIWTYSANSYECSPKVLDGKVFIGSENGLHCINADTGAKIWTFSSDRFFCTPAIYNNKLYIVNGEWDVYCIDIDNGIELWHYMVDAGFATGLISSPSISDDKLFVGSYGKVICLYADNGTIIWNYSTGDGTIYSSPALNNDKLYVGSGNDLLCLNVITGELLWSFPTANRVFSSPSVADGKVYFGSNDHKFYCLNALSGELIWDYLSNVSYAKFYSSPAIANGHVYIASSDGVIYCFKDEEIIEPQLEIYLSLNEVEGNNSFVVTVTADDNPVEHVQIDFNEDQYQTNSLGSATLFAPSVDSDTYYEIVASKTGYISDTEQILIMNVILPPVEQSQLVIEGITSVYEGEYFEMIVSAEDLPIENVMVTFLDSSVYSNSEGKVTLYSPDVEQDTSYMISFSKTGYISGSTMVKIINREGGITGTVTDSQGNYVINAMVCLEVLEKNKVITKICTFTDEIARYTITYSYGQYDIEVTKDGYSSITEEITIVENIYAEKNFVVEKIIQENPGSIADYMISKEATEGTVGAKIDFTTLDEYSIAQYDQSIDIEIENVKPLDEEGISITISGNNTNGTKIVVYLGLIDDNSNLIVEFDGETIDETNDFSSFFSEDNINIEYAIFSSGDETIAVVNVPHFSSHSISFSLEELTTEEVIRYTEFVVIGAFIIIALASILMFKPEK